MINEVCVGNKHLTPSDDNQQVLMEEYGIVQAYGKERRRYKMKSLAIRLEH